MRTVCFWAQVGGKVKKGCVYKKQGVFGPDLEKDLANGCWEDRCAHHR